MARGARETGPGQPFRGLGLGGLTPQGVVLREEPARDAVGDEGRDVRGDGIRSRPGGDDVERAHAVAFSSSRVTPSEELVPGLLELVDALVLELRGDLGVRDAEPLEAVEHLGGLGVERRHRVAGDLAVVGRGVEGLLGHGVDRARGDELGDVHRVGVGRVLDSGRRPQGPLRVGARRGERLPARGREDLLEGLVREPGVRDAGLAAQGFRLLAADGVEARVDLGVDARDEERRDRLDAREVLAVLPGLLEAGEEGVHDGRGSDRARRSASR